MVKWVNELSAIYKEVDPKYFYRQIFQHHLDTKGAFTKGKYVGIACEITKEKKGKKTIVNIRPPFVFWGDFHVLL